MKFNSLKKSSWVLVLLLACYAEVNGQISGKLYKDLNSNGLQNLPNEIGLSNYSVHAYLPGSLSPISTLTNSQGIFMFTSAQIPAGTPVRIEYPDVKEQNMGMLGTESKSNVQFVTAGLGAFTSLGVLNAIDFCSLGGLEILTPCYVNGDPLVPGGTAGQDVALVKFPYNAEGLAGSGGSPYPDMLATASQIGSVWGTAYQRTGKVFLVSALVRRHSGLGPLGTGGIYKLDDTNGTISNFIDVKTLGVDTGPDPHSTLIGDKLITNTDPNTIPATGKSGIGGMTLSGDEKTLFFINLFDRKVYSINIGIPANSANIGSLKNYTIPNGCGTGEFRPWAITEKQGQIYVGTVCSAENSQNFSELKGFVYKLDPTSGIFTQIFDFPLTYQKGLSDVSQNCPQYDEWYPWSNNFPAQCASFYDAGRQKYVGFVMYPQPILSGLAFDIDGSLIIGIMDRFGLAAGYRNMAPVDDGNLYDGFVGGDLLRAQFDPITETFTLESNGTSGDLTGCGVNNGEGPGGGEFFCEDVWLLQGNEAHNEITNGAVLILPSDGSIISSAMDPVNEVYQSGGLRTFDRTNGALKRGYALYSDVPGTLGKSGGTGDFKATCDPAPIEIGNRVWKDLDFDGIQDPEEPGIGGIVLNLYDITAGNVLVGTVTTNTAGEYSFNSGNVTGGLKYENSYEIRMDVTQGTINALGKTNLSPANISSGLNSDWRDSDANLIGNQAIATINTGFAGKTDFSLDFGITVCTPFLPLTTVTQPSCYEKTGTIEVSSPIGTGYSYSINIQSFTNIKLFENLNSGTYYLVAKDSLGCSSDTAEVIINPTPAKPTKAILQINQPTCQLAGGMITVQSPLGVGFSYGLDTLSFNNTSGIFSNLAAGNYTIYVRNADGCFSDSTRATINAQPAKPTKPVLSVTEPTCTVSTGSISVSSPVGAGLSYSLDGISFSNTTGIFNNLASGIHAIWVRNALGCMDSTKATISPQPAAPNKPVLTITQPTCTVTTGAISVSSPLGAGLSYSLDGISFTNTTGIFNNLTSGNYAIWVRNAGGCLDSTRATINLQPENPAKPILILTQPTCSVATGSISLSSPLGIGFTYSLDGINFGNTSGVFPSLEAGNYIITVRNNSNCVTLSDTAKLISAIVPSNTTATSNSPLNLGDTIILNSTSTNAISFSWSGPNGFVSDQQNPSIASSKIINGGIYTVTATSSTGCTSTATTAIVYFASMGDYAWFDLNKNGIQDNRMSPLGVNMGKELPTPGIVMELYKADGSLVAIDTTDINGLYKFDKLLPGSYYVKFNPASYPGPTYVVTNHNAGLNDSLDNDIEKIVYQSAIFNLVSGQNDPTKDIGFYRSSNPSIVDPCTCHDIIYDSDELYEVLDELIVEATPGGSWIILEQTGMQKIDTLDNFDIPIGTELKPDPTFQGRYSLKFAHDVTVGYTARITNGVDTLSINNVCNIPQLFTNAPTDTVCAFEKPIVLSGKMMSNNVDVTDGVIKFYTVEGFENYGTTGNPVYTQITEFDPTDYAPGDTVDIIAEYTPNNTSHCPVKKWYPFVIAIDPSCLAQIGDLVWKDEDKNGRQDGGESSMSNVSITLLDAAGAAVLVDVYGNSLLGKKSDALGKYSFKNLKPATYKVKFTIPTDYRATVSNILIGLDTLDSDIDTLTGITRPITLSPGEINNNIDAGFYFDEENCLKPAKPILTTTQPTCTVATGSVIVTSPKISGYTYSINGIKFTDTTGIFGSLPAGNYSIWVKNTAGCVSELTSAVINPQPATPAKPVLGVTQPSCNGSSGAISVSSPLGAGLTYSLDGFTFTDTTGIFNNLTAGNYIVWVKSSLGCTSDTSKTTIQTQPLKPNAGLDKVVFMPINIAQLTPTPNGGTWSSIATNDFASSINSLGNVSGLNNIGDYAFKYTLGACSDTAKVTVVCTKPTLTVGNITCIGNTYSVNYYSSAMNVMPSAGTISGDKVINIPIGTDLSLKASYGTNCETTLNVISPTPCDPTCVFSNLSVGQPICKGTTYSVSYKVDFGLVTSNAGTVFGDSIVNIPIGVNLIVTGTNTVGSAICRVNIAVPSPESCISTDCTNPGISVSGPLCTSNTSYSVNFIKQNDVSITTNFGIISNSTVSNIPLGNSLIVNVTKPGCTTKEIVVKPPTNCEIPCKPICIPVMVRKFK